MFHWVIVYTCYTELLLIVGFLLSPSPFPRLRHRRRHEKKRKKGHPSLDHRWARVRFTTTSACGCVVRLSQLLRAVCTIFFRWHHYSVTSTWSNLAVCWSSWRRDIYQLFPTLDDGGCPVDTPSRPVDLYRYDDTTGYTA